MSRVTCLAGNQLWRNLLTTSQVLMVQKGQGENPQSYILPMHPDGYEDHNGYFKWPDTDYHILPLVFPS